MFDLSRAKKGNKENPLFKKEAYIPKKRIQKTARVVSTLGRSRKANDDAPLKKPFRKALVIFLWLCFIGEVGYSLFFSQFFIIQSVAIEQSGDVQSLPSETLRKYMEESWQGKWYGVIPKNNLLLVSPSHFEKYLRERFPKIKEVNIERRFPGNLEVKIIEKSYQVLWCSKNDCFLIHADGKLSPADIFFQYPEEQGKVIRIQDSSEQPVSVGAKVLEAEDQAFIESFVKDFTLRTGLQWDGNIDRPAVYAREIRVRVDSGFLIFFNTRESLEKSLNNLMLVLQKEIPESEWDKIDYIDLRTENRVYYTRKDRAPAKTEEQIKREEEEQKKREAESGVIGSDGNPVSGSRR